MTASNSALVAVAALLVVVAAFLSMAEAALSRVSRTRARELVAAGRRGAARLVLVVTDPAPPLNVLLLLRTLAEMLATTMVAVAFDRALDSVWQALLVAGGVMTVVDYVVVGVGARTIGRQHPERVGLATAWSAYVLTKLLGPLPRVLIALGNVLTPGKGFREGPFTSEAELRELVDLAEQGRVIESEEREMIHSVFELGDTLTREVMVPRTDMVWIERGKTVRQALSLALRSGFSRIPVIGDNEDDIVGVAYLKDLARRVYEDEDRSEKVDEVMRPTYFIPDSKPVDELLREMQAKQVHVAIVIDEYGGTAGLVTIEDIIEEIVGEIADEYDRESPRTETLDDGSLRVNVRVPIDDVEEMFGTSFDVEDVETVGGLLASALGRVPIPGATVTIQGLTFVAESAKGRRNRVGTVLIKPTEPAAG
ncbi:MAG: magnesium and cobalt exporter, family [Frankiaceae bacterium]|jgi:CBS domain containing-hemolysin-like protein|nr:magnesium and cobalt exporter, family [Frankiaceae bacterium]